MDNNLDIDGLVCFLCTRAVEHRDTANVAMATWQQTFKMGELQRAISCAAFVTEDITLVAFLLGTDEMTDILSIAGALEPPHAQEKPTKEKTYDN